MKFEGYCSIEQAECQNGKTIGQKAGNKRLKEESYNQKRKWRRRDDWKSERRSQYLTSHRNPSNMFVLISKGNYHIISVNRNFKSGNISVDGTVKL